MVRDPDRLQIQNLECATSLNLFNFANSFTESVCSARSSLLSDQRISLGGIAAARALSVCQITARPGKDKAETDKKKQERRFSIFVQSPGLTQTLLVCRGGEL
jgi:hypothetical protein